MNFVGNKETINDMRLALLAPLASYVLYGEKGLGKATAGELFAKKILCGSRKTNCQCDSCKRFDSSNHPDFIKIKVEEDSKFIKIEQIRQAINKTYLAPNLSKRKVFFIDDANMLTVEAQNALLKTLEEGFEYNTFIFIAHKPLLPTINSRSFIFNFKPSSKKDICSSLSISGRSKDLVVAAVNGIGRGEVLSKDNVFLTEADNLLATLLKIPILSIGEFLGELDLLREKNNKGISESAYLIELLNITYHFIFDLIRIKVKDPCILFKSLNQNDFQSFNKYSLKILDKALFMLSKGIEELNKNIFNKDDLFFLFLSLIILFQEEDGLCSQ